MANIIQKQTSAKAPTAPTSEQKSVNQLMNSMLDGEKMRSRFDELLGDRAPQFISSVVSLVNADTNMQKAFFEAPMTVIQSALKAASFDLPIDQNLGYAYIVPFKNKGVMTANFILGWKGMHQLALRSGAYKTINVIDIREGELKSFNRLTEEVDLDLIEDEDQREALPVVGYLGYYRLVNGAEKTIYMTIKQIENHEKKNRKGDYQGKGWRDDWDAMARKTVYRRLIGKWGVMSITYQNAQNGAALANQMRDEGYTDDSFQSPDDIIDAEAIEVDTTSGEVIEE